MTHTWAMEFSMKGGNVRVNAIAPRINPNITIIFFQDFSPTIFLVVCKYNN